MKHKRTNSPQRWDKLLSDNQYLEDLGQVTVRRINIAKTWSKISEGNVLNIGSGQGYIENKFKKEISKGKLGWYALDISKIGLLRIKQKHPKVEIIKGSIYSLPIQKDKFKVVYCMEVLEHIPTNVTRRAYSEIKRVLIKGGIAIISVPIFEQRSLKDHPVGHIKKYTPQLIEKEITENKFKIEFKKLLFATSKFYLMKNLLLERIKVRRPNIAIYKCRV